MPKDNPATGMTAGGAIFTRLKALGVDYVFCNSGTDFPPIIEGLAEAMAEGIELPRALVIPHESAALGMAHGYYAATGKAQAVILHTNVGLANGAMGMINAATDHVPMVLMSGRTPTVEQGRFGARTVPIGWGQEMRDQTALVRETSKWDYELRFPEQVPEILDRAHAIASSTPSGPVYLSLPREVLCEQCPMEAIEAPITMAASRAAAPQGDLEQLATLLAEAEHPLIIAQRGAGTREGFDALARFAADWAVPVSHYWAGALAISYEHPSCVGSDVEPWLSEADVVLVLDGLAPWSPDVHGPKPSAKIVNLGPDPLHHRFPVRNFRSDLSITGEIGDALVRLEAMMRPQLAKRGKPIQARRAAVAKRVDASREALVAAAVGGATLPMTKAWVAKCVGEAVKDHDATVLCELGCPLDHVRPTEHGSWRDLPHSGGLGWSLPAGMGMKLADPDRLIVSTMGDGSYMFANPVACHQIAEAYEIPTLSVILNNQEWFAVRRAALGMYPKGHAAKANQMPLTALSPSPEFARIVEASRGYGQTVTDPAELPEALARGIDVVLNEKRAAVINVMVA
jgi:acetolactate synthase I/II/III large subunit